MSTVMEACKSLVTTPTLTESGVYDFIFLGHRRFYYVGIELVTEGAVEAVVLSKIWQDHPRLTQVGIVDLLEREW
jgi:hypothetical protein